MRVSFIVAAVVIAAIIIGVIQYWPELSGDVAQDVESTQVVLPQEGDAPDETNETMQDSLDSTQSTEVPTGEIHQVEDVPAVVLPALADSDAFVLDYVADWSLPGVWLQRQDLIARATGVLVNSADGRVANKQVAFLVPVESYPVRQIGEQFFIEPKGYERYDSYLDVLESVPVATMVDFLHLIEPLMNEALGQLGERRTPRALIKETVERVNALPQLPAQTELLRTSVLYTFADPQLETLPEFEKQLLRLGPRNTSRLRIYLAEFIDLY